MVNPLQELWELLECKDEKKELKFISIAPGFWVSNMSMNEIAKFLEGKK